MAKKHTKQTVLNTKNLVKKLGDVSLTPAPRFVVGVKVK